jgi:hypothetical protein
MMARSVTGIHGARFGPVLALVGSCSCGASVVVTSERKRPRGEGGARTGVVADGSERWWADDRSEGAHDRDRCEAGGGLFGEDVGAPDDGDRHDRGVGRAENHCRGEWPPRARRGRVRAGRGDGGQPHPGPRPGPWRRLPAVTGSAGAVLMLVRARRARAPPPVPAVTGSRSAMCAVAVPGRATASHDGASSLPRLSCGAARPPLPGARRIDRGKRSGAAA